MTPSSIRERLTQSFSPEEYRRVRRLWIKHSKAEDGRDIEGLISTLTPDCVYELVPTGEKWQGHEGARAFYAGLLGAFPDVVFDLTEIVIGPQGVIEVANLTGTHTAAWGGLEPTGKELRLEVIIYFPWDPDRGLFSGERIWFDRGMLPGVGF